MIEVTQQCGTCHKKLAETYFQTYHGKAYLLGYMKAARCSDCHGAHMILNVNNPNSHVGYKNIVATCRKCHANANLKFTGYLTHATHNDNPVLRYTFWGMTSLLLGVFGFFGLHTLLWLPRSIIESRKKKKHALPVGQSEYYRRFSRSQRVTHIFVILSFILLAFTGNAAQVLAYEMGELSRTACRWSLYGRQDSPFRCNYYFRIFWISYFLSYQDEN